MVQANKLAELALQLKLTYESVLLWSLRTVRTCETIAKPPANKILLRYSQPKKSGQGAGCFRCCRFSRLALSFFADLEWQGGGLRSKSMSQGGGGGLIR